MHYPINEQGRDFVLGDLHGHYTALMAKLDEVNFDFTKDRLFSVGDLIDRGPESSQCLDLIYEPWFHAVMGNHEEFMVESTHDRIAFVNWLDNGGLWGIDLTDSEHFSYAKDINTNMPPWMTVETPEGTVGIVHAEPPSDWSAIEYTDLQTLLWERRRITIKDTSIVKNIDCVVCGHTPNSNGPVVLGNVVFIDCNIRRSGRVPLFLISEMFEFINKISS